MTNNLVPFPLVTDADEVWLQFLEKSGNKLDLRFYEPVPDYTATQWTLRLAQVLTRYRTAITHDVDVAFFCFFHVDDNETSMMGAALFALLALLREQIVALQTDSKMLSSLAFAPNLTELRGLTLAGDWSEKDGYYLGLLLRECPNLDYLDLGECSFIDEDLQQMSSVPVCPLMERFDMSFTRMSAEGMKCVSRMLQGWHHIRELNFGDGSGSMVTGAMEGLNAALAGKESFEVYNCFDKVGDNDFRGDHWQKLVFLESLSIHFCGTDDGFDQMCRNLRSLKCLETFKLQVSNEHWSLEKDRMLAEFLQKMDCQIASFSFALEESVDAELKHMSNYVASPTCSLRYFDLQVLSPFSAAPLISALKSNKTMLNFRLHLKGRHEAELMEDLATSACELLQHNYRLRGLSLSCSFSLEQYLKILSGARTSTIERLTVGMNERTTEQVDQVLEDLANDGYLIELDRSRMSDVCAQLLALNKKMHDAARQTACAMLALRRFRKSYLNSIPYDVVKVIAARLFATRAKEEWSSSVVHETKKQRRTK